MKYISKCGIVRVSNRTKIILFIATYQCHVVTIDIPVMIFNSELVDQNG